MESSWVLKLMDKMDEVDLEGLKERLAEADHAVGTLEATLREPVSDVVRDLAILRFIYSFESVWKVTELHLMQEEPKAGKAGGVVDSSRKAGIMTQREADAALEMMNDRYLAVHTYVEPLATEVYGRLRGHAKLMRTLLGRIQGRR